METPPPQVVIWTALPNGFSKDGKKLRLSILVSPRLTPTQNVETTTLDHNDFSAFSNWPSALQDAEFTLVFGTKPAKAERVSRPDSELWPQIFPKKTPVRSHKFDDYGRDGNVSAGGTDQGYKLLYFPTGHLHDLIKDTYGTLAAQTMDGRPPSAGDLLDTHLTRLTPYVDNLPRRKPASPQEAPQPSGEALAAKAFRDKVRGAKKGALSVLEAPSAFVPDVLKNETDRVKRDWAALSLLAAYYRPYDKYVELPRPDQFQELIDFHQIVSALNQHQELLRRLGLVIDLQAPSDAFGGAVGEQQLQVSVAGGRINQLGNICPFTMTRLTPHTFSPARRGADTPYVDGFLALNSGRFQLLQCDLDGGVIKLKNVAMTLAQTAAANAAAEEEKKKLKNIDMTLAQAAIANPAADEAEPKAPKPGATPETTDAEDGDDDDAPFSANTAGAPSLRTAGLMVADSERANTLDKAFSQAGTFQKALQDEKHNEIVLYQEDLVRGLHVDVGESLKVGDSMIWKWRSLCRRDGTYVLKSNGEEIKSTDEEGIVRLGVTTSPDKNDSAKLLKMTEVLFAWNGWSLTAPMPGKTLKTDAFPGQPETDERKNQAADGLPLSINYEVRQGSLPSLRYGRDYYMRARLVDLAHNARDFDGGTLGEDSTVKLAVTNPVTYRRFEPVEPPAVVLVEGETAPGEGESMTTLAIRSMATDEGSLAPAVGAPCRWIVPPRVSHIMAERHGVLDKDGKLDPDKFLLLKERDEPFKNEHGYSVAPADLNNPPYLPDPLSRTVWLRIIYLDRFSEDGVRKSESFQFPYYASKTGATDDRKWPDAWPFKVQLREKSDGHGSEPDWKTRTLFIALEKGEKARLEISHMLPAALDGRDGLDLMGIWEWLKDKKGANAKPHDIKTLEEIAWNGRHWMLTPWRTLDLVHAVQRPVVVPNFKVVALNEFAKDQGRPLNGTYVDLKFSAHVHAASTSRLDLVASWYEPTDDVRDAEPKHKRVTGHAFDIRLTRKDARSGVFGSFEPRHEFGDTRCRRVTYKLVATSRYGEFMPKTPKEMPAEAMRVVSGGMAVWIPNSAPPPPPKVLYVVPTFGWVRHMDSKNSKDYSLRGGGGLRVYLDRPWLATGYNEMLAVVLRAPPWKVEDFDGWLKPYVTQWGRDPIWKAGLVDAPSPSTSDFPLAQWEGAFGPETRPPVADGPQQEDKDELDMEGQIPADTLKVTGKAFSTPDILSQEIFNIAPHPVAYDQERKLWYCDIVVRPPQKTYFPFLRLALARFQPVSVPGAHLSSVVLSDFIQVAPDRLVVLTRHSKESWTLSVHGYTSSDTTSKEKYPPEKYSDDVRRKTFVEVRVEQLDSTDRGDLDWRPLQPNPVKVSLPPIILSPPSPSSNDNLSDILKGPQFLEKLSLPVLWTGEIKLPLSATGERHLRAFVTEFERHRSDGGFDERIVFAAAVELI